ncbi:serine peptidase [Streptomycetaceae bacterium NBC_01309]
MTRIVAVHGVGNHVPGYAAAEVSAERSVRWAADLATGLQLADPGALDVAYAYYAPHLHAGVPVAQSDPLAEDALDHLDADAAQLAAQWLEAVDLPDVTPQGRLAVPLRAAVELLAERYSLDGRLTRAFVAVAFPEVARYVRTPDSPARLAARDEVARTIAGHRPRVVVAHSLGTVVTYEALHAHPELSVDLLITLGSPLALPNGVFHRLNPAPGAYTGRGIRPPGVARWVNIADRGDPVAVLRPLGDYFTNVDSDLPDSIAPFDFHMATNYLRCPATANALRAYLGPHQ